MIIAGAGHVSVRTYTVEGYNKRDTTNMYIEKKNQFPKNFLGHLCRNSLL